MGTPFICDVNKEICDIFYLNSKDIRKIEIVFEPNSPAIVKIEKYLYDNEYCTLKKILRKLDTKPKENE